MTRWIAVLLLAGCATQPVPFTYRNNILTTGDGRTLYTTFESNLNGALTYSGPDALLYALDVLTPQLANALNGRPVADLSAA